MELKSIGVVGLGIMGSAITRNLIKAGYAVSVFNRTRERALELSRLGALVKDSPRALAEASQVIVLIVSNPEAVQAVCQGADGLLAARAAGRILIQSSTINIETTLSIAEEVRTCGYEFLDCPVSGSKKQAQAGELIFDCGGEAEVVERVRPVLLAFGKHIVHAGPIGAGTALKLCINLLVAQMNTGLCESVALARALKVDPARIFEVISNSPALNCAVFTSKKDPLLNKDYAPAFSLANMLKDVRFMNAAAQEAGLRLEVNNAVQSLMEKAESSGDGEKDLSVMVEQVGKA